MCRPVWQDAFGGGEALSLFFLDSRTYFSKSAYFSYLQFEAQRNTASITLQQTAAYVCTQLASIIIFKRTTEGTQATVHRCYETSDCIGQRCGETIHIAIHCACATHSTIQINAQAGEVEDEVANERRDCESYGKETAVERLDHLRLRREQAEEIKYFQQ